MRRWFVFLLIASFFAPNAIAQAPTDGRVESSAYVNTFFHISYQWPKILQAYDTKSLALSQLPPSDHEWLLFTARKGSEPYGVIMLAEKLNVPTQHSKGTKSADDFMISVRQEVDKWASWRVVSESRPRNADGIPMMEMDYIANGEVDAAVVAEMPGFLIVFKCNAKSASELAEMTKSAIALHHIK